VAAARPLPRRGRQSQFVTVIANDPTLTAIIHLSCSRRFAAYTPTATAHITLADASAAVSGTASQNCPAALIVASSSMIAASGR
jgi:hypothetical protein